jgi:hypothetical protein
MRSSTLVEIMHLGQIILYSEWMNRSGGIALILTSNYAWGGGKSYSDFSLSFPRINITVININLMVLLPPLPRRGNFTLS